MAASTPSGRVTSRNILPEPTLTAAGWHSPGPIGCARVSRGRGVRGAPLHRPPALTRPCLTRPCLTRQGVENDAHGRLAVAATAADCEHLTGDRRGRAQQ